MAEFGVGSDYKTVVTFMADGAVIAVTSINAPAEFELEYYTTNQNLKKIASKIGGVYTNCTPQVIEGVSRLVVAFDDVGWGEGDVICRAETKYADNKFPDGHRTYVIYIETGDSYVRL